MSDTLARIAAECHRILATDPGLDGRRQVAALVEELCRDAEFVAEYLGDRASARDILYEDPELGFCILAHVDRTSRQSQPHDHGSTWAIYGQVAGETIMTDWAVVDPPRGKAPGKVRRVREYALKPGSVHLYNEGDVHAPLRVGVTRLLRVEGRNIKDLECDTFEAI
jgi:hypothetical protein